MEKSIYLKQIDNESKHWWFKARREILNNKNISKNLKDFACIKNYSNNIPLHLKQHVDDLQRT